MAFTVKDWQDAPSTTTPINAAALEDLERRVYNAVVADAGYADDVYALVGNGTTDDTTPLTAALQAGGRITFRPGKTYLVNAEITGIPAGTIIDLNGSTIKKKSTHPSQFVTIANANVTIKNGTFDGNRTAVTADTGGVYWTGTGGLMQDVIVKSNKQWGVSVDVTGTLTCIRVAANDNRRVSPAGAGYGFSVSSTATNALLQYDCSAETNELDGVVVWPGSGYVRVFVSTKRNGRAGLNVFADGGHIAYVRSNDDDTFGVNFESSGGTYTPTDWTADYIEAIDTGRTAAAASASGVELRHALRFSAGTITARGQQGYGLALATGCIECEIGIVNVGRTVRGTVNDPGVTITEASKRNRIGILNVDSATFALTIGEDSGGSAGSDDNMIGQINASNCGYGVLRIENGSRNRVGPIRAVNCGTAGAPSWNGLLDITTASGASDGNIIDSITHAYTNGAVWSTASSGANLGPRYIAYAATGTKANLVREIVSVGSQKEAVRDDGQNIFIVREPVITTRLGTFEAAETWTGTNTADTTAGHFVRGTQGRNVVGTGPGREIYKDFGSAQDLSAVDWFRIWIYAANIADIPSGWAFSIYFQTTAPFVAYYAFDVGMTYGNFTRQSAGVVAGGQFIQFQKTDCNVGAGVPSWSNINRVSLFVPSAGGGSPYSLTFDDLVTFNANDLGQLGSSYHRHLLGYHRRSEVIWELEPSASASMGLVCTTTGAPGTFKAMPNLSA